MNFSVLSIVAAHSVITLYLDFPPLPSDIVLASVFAFVYPVIILLCCPLERHTCRWSCDPPAPKFVLFRLLPHLPTEQVGLPSDGAASTILLLHTSQKAWSN
jgi:hypothetical protein